MVSNISALFTQLDRYAHRELSLEALHDQISLGLQEYFDEGSEEDIEILSEVLSAIYEVEDAVLDKEEFRQAIKELIDSQATPSVITVGRPPTQIYRPYLVRTSTSSASFSVVMKAA